jgi:hypothetical protein
MIGTVELWGSKGESVTDGHASHVKSPTTPISITQNGPGDVDITIGGEVNNWEIGLSSPNGERFTARTYGEASRYPFADPGRPGLSVSGGGRGEINGDFTIKEIAYDAAGQIVHVVEDFHRLCDDNPNPLTGSLDLVKAASN